MCISWWTEATAFAELFLEGNFWLTLTRKSYLQNLLNISLKSNLKKKKKKNLKKHSWPSDTIQAIHDFRMLLKLSNGTGSAVVPEATLRWNARNNFITNINIFFSSQCFFCKERMEEVGVKMIIYQINSYSLIKVYADGSMSKQECVSWNTYHRIQNISKRLSDQNLSGSRDSHRFVTVGWRGQNW